MVGAAVFGAIVFAHAGATHGAPRRQALERHDRERLAAPEAGGPGALPVRARVRECVHLCVRALVLSHVAPVPSSRTVPYAARSLEPSPQPHVRGCGKGAGEGGGWEGDEEENGGGERSVAGRDRVGTPRYMAPELLLGTEYNAKIDVYSGSLVLWFMVIGQTPHQFMDGGAHVFMILVRIF